MDWVADALFVFAPLASAGVLGYIIASVLPFGTLFWVSLSVFVLFPIFFLSALDEQFWIGFHSLRVYKSLCFARGAWGALYLYQLVLIGILGVATAVAWGLHRALVGSPSWIVGFNIMGVFLALAGVLSLLVYARALGRLVWVISETEKGLENDDEALEEEEEDEAEESEGEE